MHQQILFDKYLDPIKLKEGKSSCPCCGRPMKAYGYNLDEKLVDLAWEILRYCSNAKTPVFKPKDVFQEKLRANTQFQKLKCFGIIKRMDRAGYWKITWTGYKFLQGRVKLPRKVWIFRDKVILKDEVKQGIQDIEPRWKEYYSDWTMDYILQPYETIFKF